MIMITPFDIFEEGRYAYTFVPCCKENKALELEDGAVRIFLNTRGTNDEEITPELRAFLRYVESTDGEFAENSGSERLKKIHACVDRIKASEKVGVKYMQRWEEREWDRAEARAEGRAEGLAEGRAEGLAEGRAEGQQTVLDSMRKLMQEKNMTAEEALNFLEISNKPLG